MSEAAAMALACSVVVVTVEMDLASAMASALACCLADLEGYNTSASSVISPRQEANADVC
jgi:hypothetical protein